jgi:opacity protein-like surface antigen
MEKTACCIRIAILLSLVIGISIKGKSQYRQLEIHVGSSWEFANYSIESCDVSAGVVSISSDVVYFFKPKFGVGLNFDIPISNTTSASNGDEHWHGYDTKAIDISLLAYFSTNREKRMRVYGTAGINYLNQSYTLEGQIANYNPVTDEIEMVYLPDKKVSSAGFGLSLGAGVGIKLNKNLTFKLIDAKVILFSKGYPDSAPALRLESGFIFGFLRKK